MGSVCGDTSQESRVFFYAGRAPDGNGFFVIGTGYPLGHWFVTYPPLRAVAFEVRRFEAELILALLLFLYWMQRLNGLGDLYEFVEILLRQAAGDGGQFLDSCFSRTRWEAGLGSICITEPG